MGVREVEAILQIDDRDGEKLAELDEFAHGGLVSSQSAGQDHRILRLDQQVRRFFQGAEVRLDRCRRHESVHVQERNFVFDGLLLNRHVETDIGRPLRLRIGDPVCPGEGVRHGGNGIGLVIPFHIVPDGIALHQGRVDPIDMRPPFCGVHGTGGPGDHHRDPVHVCIIDGHGSVQQPDEVMQNGQHRLPRDLGIPMGYPDSRVLMRALDDLRFYVASIMDQRIVQGPEGRSGVYAGVFDIVLLDHIHNHIGTISLLRHLHLLWSLILFLISC